MRVLLVTAQSASSASSAAASMGEHLTRFFHQHALPFEVVHSDQLVAAMLADAPAPFVVVDARPGTTWLSSVINDVLACYVGMPRPEVVVVGEASYPASEARLWGLGISNWYPTTRIISLLKHWHWVQCNSRELQDDVLRVNGQWIRPFATGRRGYLDVWDAQLHVRIPVVNGRLGLAQIRDFESDFLRAAMREANVGIAARARAAVLDRCLPTPALGVRAASSLVRARLYAMLETQQRNVLRWLGATRPVRVAWRETAFPMSDELTFGIDELLTAESAGSRFGSVHLAGSLATSHVANDTTLAEVS